MVVNVSCKFISQKVNKIRWKPVATDVAIKPDTFICGGWQNAPNTTISVWQCSDLTESVGHSNGLSEKDDVFNEKMTEPRLLCQLPFDGDVTDIKYLHKDLMVVGSSTGSVALYKHNSNQFMMPQLEINWTRSHQFKSGLASCTALDCYGENIVSVGEDGRLIEYNIRQKKPISILEADSCSITAVSFLKHNEVITCNTQGQLNVWDLRKGGEPAKLFLTSGDKSALLALSRHPTLPNILAVGSEDGTLILWDLKQEKYPETILSAHKGPILELKFHPQSPNHLFTCSMDGSIWHWNSSGLQQDAIRHFGIHKNEEETVSTPWLLSNTSKQNLEICSLIPSSSKPINSLDILQDVLICGSDNEAFYIIRDLKC